MPRTAELTDLEARLNAALVGGRFNEAALLLRGETEPDRMQTALALATPYRNKFDLAGAFAELSARAKLTELTPEVCRVGLLERGLQEADVERVCSNSAAVTQLGVDLAEAVRRAPIAAAPGGSPDAVPPSWGGSSGMGGAMPASDGGSS